jgi:hypothetical protein
MQLRAFAEEVTLLDFEDGQAIVKQVGHEAVEVAEWYCGYTSALLCMLSAKSL